MMPVNRSVRAMDADVTNQYWITLYWVITTMTTIGFGDIKPQTQYEIWTCILCQIIGAAAFGFIVGNMTNIAQLLNGRKEKITGEINELNLLLRHFKAPRDLQRHATKLVRHQFHMPVKLIKRDIIDRVPTWIAVDIAKEAFRNVLHRCKLFGQASDHVLDKLYLRLQPVTLVPGEYLFRARDRSRAIIFVLNGTVHMIDNDPSARQILRTRSASWYSGATSPQNVSQDDVVSSVLSGGFVGENSLICGLDFFKYSARAQRTCNLLYLPASDIKQAFEDSRQDLTKIRMRCQLRQSRFQCLIKLTRILRHVF
jgi:CRP-like cAMP-binding protein